MADVLIDDLEDLSFIDDTDEEGDLHAELHDDLQGEHGNDTKDVSLKSDNVPTSSKAHLSKAELESQAKTVEISSEKCPRQLHEAYNDKQKLNSNLPTSDEQSKCVIDEELETQANQQNTQAEHKPVHVEVNVNVNSMERKKTSNVVTVELHGAGPSQSVPADTDTAGVQARHKPHSDTPSTSKYLHSRAQAHTPDSPHRTKPTTSTDRKAEHLTAEEKLELEYYEKFRDSYSYSVSDDYSLGDSHRTESVTSPDLSHSDTLRSLKDILLQSSEELPHHSEHRAVTETQTERDLGKLKRVIHTPAGVSDSQTQKDLTQLKSILQTSKDSPADSVDDNIDGHPKYKPLMNEADRPTDIGDLSRNSASRRSSRKKSRAIRIVVTNEEGVDEHVEDISHARGPSFKGERSPDSDSSGGSYNYLKKICAQRKTSVAEEITKKKKVKPFKQLQKLNRGCFEVGIDGDKKRCNIKAISLMKDKRLVMFDRNNKCLKLFDKDFVPLDRLSISGKFCAVASVFEHTIAVTLPEDKRLQMYHVNKNKFEKGRVHPLEAEFYSVAHYKGMLYLLKRTPKLGLTENDDWQIVSLDLNKGNTDAMKVMRKFSPGHQDNTLLANSSGLYMTHKLENEIVHLGLDGSFKQKYKILMSLPMGITSDRYGNIYVCGGSVTSFIEVCKFNLKGSRIIYHKTSSDPVAVCFDKQDSVLYVCDKILGNVTKYKIEHNGTIQGLMKSFAMGNNV